MSTKLALLALLVPSGLFAQATANGVCKEMFDSSTIAAQWHTIGTSVSWYSAGTTPGMYTVSTSSGAQYMACPVGTGPFNLSAKWDRTAGNWKALSFAQAGTSLVLSTGIPGSQTSTDASIVIAASNAGIYVGLRSGESQANAGTDVSGLVVSAQTYSAMSPNHSNGDSVDWPQGTSSGGLPNNWHWWYTVSRDGSNNLAFSIFTDHYQNGTSPWNTWTYAIPSAYQTKSFQYLSVLGYGSIAGGTNGFWSDINLYTTVTGGTAHTVTSVVPSSASGTIQSGNAATITGTNFDCANYPTYSVRVGAGPTLGSVNATCVSSTKLTISSLPSETNNDGTTHWIPYLFHVLNSNNVDAEVPAGLTYHTGTVFSFVPYEVPTAPANNADATITITGSGFSSGTTATFGGNSGTVTYVNPTQITVIVPAGTAGSPRVIITDPTAGTLYDSNTSATYPYGVKLNFGYRPGAYLWFTPSVLATMRAAWSNPTYTHWMSSVNRLTTSPGPFAENSRCAPVWTTCITPEPGAYISETWWLFKYLASADSTSYTNFWADLATTNDLARIDWSNSPNSPQSFNESWAADMALAYDSMYLSLTPAQRWQFEQLFDSLLTQYNYLGLTGDGNTQGSAGGSNNRVAFGNACGGIVAAAVYNSHNSIQGYLNSAPWISTTAATLVTRALGQLTTWGNQPWMSDGGYTEGRQYSEFGGQYFAMFTQSLVGLNGMLGNGLGNQGLLGTNIKFYANYVDQSWIGPPTWWSQANDTQPLPYGTILSYMAQQLNNPQLLYVADYQNAALDGFSDDIFYSMVSGAQFYGYAWRTTATVTPAFTGWNLSSIQPAASRATLRSQSSIVPDFEILLEGLTAKSAPAGGHEQPDSGSFEIPGWVTDPGYYAPNVQYSPATAHSVPIVDGVAPADGSASRFATVDTSANYDNGTCRAALMDSTPSYPSAVTRVRRHATLCASGSDRFAVILDDIVATGAGAVTSQFQLAQPVSSATTSGFKLTGSSATMFFYFNGPTVSAVTPTVLTYCPTTGTDVSWQNCYMGNYWASVNMAYTAATNTPMLTLMSQGNSGGTGQVTFSSVTRNTGANTITATMSDGIVLNYALNTSNQWLLTSASSGPSCTLSPFTLPAGTVSSAYSQRLTATSCSASTWTVVHGGLPPGLSLNASTGAITGTPTTPATYPVTISYTGNTLNFLIQILPSAPAALNWPDRRPIVMQFVSGRQYASSTNPFGYACGGGTSFNATQAAVLSCMQAIASSTVTYANNYASTHGVQPQGIILWDGEGQEMQQSLSYIGDPAAFLAGAHGESPYNPNIAAIQAYAQAVKAAGYRFGITIRPQHLTWTDTAHLASSYSVTVGTTCPSATWQFQPQYILSDAAYFNKNVSCDSSTGNWIQNGGNQHQSEHANGDFSGEITELQTKINRGATNLGATLFYVDSNVFNNGSVIDENVYTPLQASNPTILMMPEEHNTALFTSSSPFSDLLGTGTPMPSSTSLAATPTAFFFTKSDQCVGSCWTNFGAQMVLAMEGGMVIASGPGEAPGVPANLLAAWNSSVLLSSSVNVTGNGNVHSFNASPTSAYTYPLQMRVYFADTAAHLATSTVYCSSDCTLDLTQFHYYVINFYDFAGNGVQLPGAAQPL